MASSVKENLAWCWERRNRVDEIFYELWSNVRPGGRLHPAWFFEAKGHLAVELLLFAVIFYLLTRKSFKPRKEKPLTRQEQEELIAEWTPEPLAPSVYATANDKQNLRSRTKGQVRKQIRYARAPVVKGKASAPHVQIGSKRLLNLVSTNFLNLADSERVEEECVAALDKYGCGSCGPRGFYGTIDVHLELETRMAKFLGMEEAILYSYDISTPASAIPAFCKSGDLIVADAGVGYPLQSGMALSRSTVRYFKHNDLGDLRNLLDTIEEESKLGKGKDTQRRFMVVEGVYANYGDVAPLREIVELKEKHRFRLILDDSFALGVLGETGRGSLEHHDLRPEQVDIMLASLGHSFGSVGGICAGNRRVCDHQRLSGAGYVFSASLPPYLASAAIKSLDIIEEEGKEMIAELEAKTDRLRCSLTRALSRSRTLRVHEGMGPVIHLQLVGEKATDVSAVESMQGLVDAAARDGVFLTVAKYTFLDRYEGPPSIRIAVNVAHDEADLDRAVTVIKKAASKAGLV